VTDHGLGALPSPPDDRDFPIEQLYALTGQEKAIVIPAVYYAPNETYAPLNQGTTPQCVAYSSGAMKLCQDGMWPLDAGTFFKRIGGGPNGAITRNAFDQLLKVGYPPDEANHMIGSYWAVKVIQAEIQAAIMAFGPVVLSVTWYHSWFTPIGGVLPAEDYPAGDHAILAFGWDSKGLRLRNSWGTKWGNGGDCYLPWSMLSAVGEVWKAVDTIPTPPEADMIALSKPVRVFDGPIPAKTPVAFPIAGAGSIPPTATAAAVTLRVDKPPLPFWVYAGPAAGAPPATPEAQMVSTLDFEPGGVTDGFPICGLTNGKLTIYSPLALPRLVIDVTAVQ
jgi:hypothetical protein